MAILSSDADGFLTGPRIDDNALTDELGDIRDSLDGIEAGVKSIEALLTRAGIRAAGESQRRVAVEPVGGGASNQKERKGGQNARTPTTAGERGGESEIKKAARRHPVVVEGGNKKAALPTETRSKKAAEDGPRKPFSHKTAEPRVSHAPRTAVAGARSAVNGVGNAAPKKGGKGVAAVTPEAAPKIATPANGAVAEPAPRKRRKAKETEAAEAQTPVRDSKGRFVGKGASSGGDGFFNGSAAGEEERSAALLAGKIADAVVEGTEGLGDADPTVQAINEVATPISRGFGVLKEAWGDDENAGWLRKIYRGLGRFHKEQSAFNTAEKKQLKAIASNTDGIDELGRGGKDGGGLMGSLFGNLKGMLAGIAPALAMFAKRIPIIGGVLAGAKGIFDVFDSEWDERLTRSQKDRKTGKAIGSAGGTIAGGFAGAKAGALVGAAFGPIGGIVGGVVGSVAGMWFGKNAGDVLGETVGGWVATLREADIPGKISEAWSGFTESLSASWDGFTESLKATWTGITDTLKETWSGFADTLKTSWDSVVGGVSAFWDRAKSSVSDGLKSITDGLKGVGDWVKDKTDIDISGAVTNVTSKVSGAITGIVSKVKSTLSTSSEGKAQQSPSNAGKAAHSDGGAAPDAANWKLGQTSEYFESGNKGAGTISSGMGDYGGKSYGTYQLSSNSGTLRSFIRNSGYKRQLTARPGTAAFDEQWRALAENDPNFAQAQHDYIKKTHYDRAASSLRANGVDLSGRGKAVQDMLWSTSVQFGAGNAGKGKGGAGIVMKALHGRDVADMSDAEIIEAVQNYKLANNDKLFASSSANVRKGTARRAAIEKDRLLKLNGLERGEQNPAAKRVAKSVGLAAPDTERDESNPEKAQAEAQAKMLFAGTLDKTNEAAAKLDPANRSFANDVKAAPKDFKPTIENAEKLAERRKERRNEAAEIFHSQQRAAAEAKIAETADVSDSTARRDSDLGARDNRNAQRLKRFGWERDLYEDLEVYAPRETPKTGGPVGNSAAVEVAAHAPRLAMPAAPAVPAAPPAPAMKAPLASNDKGGAVTVRLQNETPQDVKDRAIALVATGGYSGNN